jgi:hypothetical protein
MSSQLHITMPLGPLTATCTAMRTDCDISDTQYHISTMKQQPYKIKIQPHVPLTQPMYIPVQTYRT